MIEVRYGNRGNAVKKLQQLLRIDADGIFGRGTLRAVKAYQKRSELPSTGIVDFATWKSLFTDRISDEYRHQITLEQTTKIPLSFDSIPDIVDQALPLFNVNSRNRDMLISGFEVIYPYRVELELDTPKRLMHFLAQIREEVGRRIVVEESLNYSCKALKSVFRYYRNNPNEAKLDGRCLSHSANQIIIARKAYGGRMGNERYPSMDGWVRRGRGAKMITGTKNYKSQDNYVKKHHPDIYENYKPFDNPDDLKSKDFWLLSGAIFWKENGLSRYADKLDKNSSYAITKKVNRWTGSYRSRFKHLTVLNAVFNVA